MSNQRLPDVHRDKLLVLSCELPEIIFEQITFTLYAFGKCFFIQIDCKQVNYLIKSKCNDENFESD